MAQQLGIVRFRGTMGNITFYKSQDGYLAKEKPYLDKKRIAKDPAFARSRENAAEFSAAATAGKVLRKALRPLMSDTADNRVASRIVQVMMAIAKLDTVSARGKRSVQIPIVSLPAQSLLKGFDFNKQAVLDTLLSAPYEVKVDTGQIGITGFVPATDLSAPKGATHVTLTGAWAKIDFSNEVFNLQCSQPANLPINKASANVSLLPATPATGNGINLFLLHIGFFQEINAVQYPFNKGSNNALAIVEVS